MEKNKKPIIVSRKIAVLLADGYNYEELMQVKEALTGNGAHVKIISKFLGTVKSADGKEIEADKSHITTGSIMFDAVYVPGGKAHLEALEKQGDALHFLNEAFKHCKPIAASGDATTLLKLTEITGVDLSSQAEDKLVQSKGVVTMYDTKDMQAFSEAFLQAIGQHRHWDREEKDMIPA